MGKQLSLKGLDIFDIAEHFSSFLYPQDNECYGWDGPIRNGTPFYPPLNKRAKVVAYEILNNVDLPPHVRIYNTCGSKTCINPQHFAKPNSSKTKKKHRVPLGEQANKRSSQAELNTRLVYYICEDERLYGDIIILPGIKYVEATQPYLNEGIARNILMCEERLDTFLEIQQKLSLDPQLYSQLRLYSSTVDILDVIPTVVTKGKWTGFDLDFSGTITEKRKKKLHKAIQSITTHQKIWWMRVTITVRPSGTIKTRTILNDLLKYMVACGSLYIEDLATGPVFAYCDSAPMQTMQFICKRR